MKSHNTYPALASLPALTVSAAFAMLTTAPAAVLVTEPFNYTIGVHTSSSSNNWVDSMGTGSGTGWTREWSSDFAGPQIGISSGGHTGTFLDSTGVNYPGNDWRQREMTPVHSNDKGAVTWQYLTVSANGIGTAGWLALKNSYGGMDFAVRVEADGTYGLGVGLDQGTTDTSTIPVSQSALTPDIVVVKMTNQMGDGTLFDVSMWINPTASTEGGLSTPDLQVLGADASYGNLNIGNIEWHPGNTQFDNFTLASAYSDLAIIPEPGVMGLLGLGLLPLVSRRRR